MLYFAVLALMLFPSWAQTAHPAVQNLPKETPSKEDTRKVLVVFGDSLSAGYGLRPGQSFPDDLQRKLDAQGYAWRVVNLGISGDTTQGGLARINTALAAKPAVVVLELGGNDGLRGGNLDAMRGNLDAMVAAAQKAGSLVVLVGMQLPPNYGTVYVQRFAATFAEVAAARHAVLVPFLLEGFATDDSMFQGDRVHPVVAAQPKLLDNVWPVLEPLLGQARRAP